MMKLFLFLAVLVTAVAADVVTDELEKNGLPVGLLRSSISTYSIDKDGQFALSLEAPCYAKIDDQLGMYESFIMGKNLLMRVGGGSYTSFYSPEGIDWADSVSVGVYDSTLLIDEMKLAYYSQNITGTLKYGSISNLEGIQTKQLFVWLAITGIYVDVPATPYIYFEVGVFEAACACCVRLA